MPRKNEPSEVDLDETAERYQSAWDLRESVIDAACHFGADDGFDAAWSASERLFKASRAGYVKALIRLDHVYRP